MAERKEEKNVSGKEKIMSVLERSVEINNGIRCLG